MADKTIQYTEFAIGANHPTLVDTLNRLSLVEHNTDGTHNKLTKVMDPWVDVRAFGAKGDGVTDDSVAINAALNYGGITWISRGNYVIGSAIQIPAGGTLRGDVGSVFLRPNNTTYTNNSMIQNKNWSSDTRSDANIVIDGISIVGNRANNSTTANGIYIRSATNVKIRNCYVTAMGKTPNDFSGQGIIVSNVLSGVIEGNYVYANAGDGINAYTLNNHVVIRNNDASSNGVAGIEVEGRLGTDYTNYRNNGVTVTGNRVYNNAGGSWGAYYGEGILVDWSDEVLVSNNVVSGTSVWVGAITGIGNTNLSITSNVVTNNITATTDDPGGYGIALWAQYDVYGVDGINKDCIISGNVLKGNKNGIFSRDSQSLTIEGNTVVRTDDTNNGIIAEFGTAGKILSVLNNTVRLSGSGTGIGIKDNYPTVTIHGNTIISSGSGILLYPASATFDRLSITKNIFDTCTNGIFTFSALTLSNGRIEKNTFLNTTTYDLNYDTTSPTLSSFFVLDNIHDKGMTAWGSVGAVPTTGTWKVGDRVVNTTPTVGQPKAWSCTVAGTPGTWVSEGNL